MPSRPLFWPTERFLPSPSYFEEVSEVMLSHHDCLSATLNRHLMRRGIPYTAPPLIVNLGRRDVLVIQQVLHGFDKHAASSRSVAVVARRECGE